MYTISLPQTVSLPSKDMVEGRWSRLVRARRQLGIVRWWRRWTSIPKHSLKQDHGNVNPAHSTCNAYHISDPIRLPSVVQSDPEVVVMIYAL